MAVLMGYGAATGARDSDLGITLIALTGWIYPTYHEAKSRGYSGKWAWLGPIGARIMHWQRDKSRDPNFQFAPPPLGSFDERVLRFLYFFMPWRKWPWPSQPPAEPPVSN
jgi:hypothetical protein